MQGYYTTWPARMADTQNFEKNHLSKAVLTKLWKIRTY